MRPLARSYLQHGRRHLPTGSDPIGLGISNDWVIAQAALGTVTNGSSPVNASFSSINYQTDDGSVFGVHTGTVDAISMLVVGTYLIRARATFPAGRTGTVQLGAVIAGDVTTYDYDTAVGGTNYSDIGPGEATWEQLCIVNDLTVPAGAYMNFTQTTGSSMVSCVGWIQIFRIT